ncbi:putative Dehydrogenase/reductase [Cladorrhinum sp. PSN259]|nr:putative Dehydrogenase/reductase [Cladorrhinum sp. PSN259]
MALQLTKYLLDLRIPPSYFAHVFKSQFFTKLPLPSTSYTSKTIIITGANGGLGLEAAKHYVRLGAARVILACRSTDRGEKAKSSINVPPENKTVIEVWPLDLCSFESVKSFCKRATKELDRLDVLLLNAGVAMGEFELSEGGYETTITTNVISTFFVAVKLLPLLRRTGIERNEEGHLTVVASEAHYFTAFKERHEEKIFETFKKDDGKYYWGDRYAVSKLLDVLLTRELAETLDQRAGGANKIPIIVNSVNPGLCGATSLFRSVPWFVSIIVVAMSWIMARTSDQGARILMSAAEGGRETHGKYIDSGKVLDPSPFALSEEGKKAGKKAWGELMEILEDIEPGSTFILG